MNSASSTDTDLPLSARLFVWAKLVRLPNAFTVIADVSAAFLLVLGASGWLRSGDDAVASVWGSLALVIGSGVALYWGGMVLNDVFDVRADRRARSGRPLPQREIRLADARRAGWGFLLIGCGLAFFVDLVPGAIALLLSGCIVAYDGPFKRTRIAPVLMGGCRVLSFLLGATSAHAIIPEAVWQGRLLVLGEPIGWHITPVTLAFAFGMGLYITGVTTFARREAIGDRSFHLPLGWFEMAAGGVLLAFAPRAAVWFAEQDIAIRWTEGWQIDPVVIFPLTIALMIVPTLVRGWNAWQSPSPKRIQFTIKSAIMAIIPLMAAITMLGAGAIPSLCIFALILPSMRLARRFRVT
ncbi:UbiA family prenyltransferase [Rhodopirellula halodulae]|uniref:UbiA family prenyltransferase n=1 Tax=Rhodopirellula halodulae TaxID=2894198 RepID=UPI001E57B406|nr:UbiA family prenyltransferase [Rhodopirellula sp. JC737]MCC9655810.1 UbiA family prenyltransferase [Rhodopirellula sp. JC737]